MFEIITDVLIFILGLCLGSFLNVVIHRLPREDVSISSPPRSVCPSCDSHIGWYDNLPMVSYIFLLGKCRHCQTRISIRYPLVELMSGVLTLAVFFKFGMGIRFFLEVYFVLGLVAITYIDLDEMIIPDAITLPGIALGLIGAAVAPDYSLIGPWLGGVFMSWGVENLRWLSIIGSVLGMIVGGGSVWVIFQAYYLWRKEEGIGGGDFTLLAMVGAFLGWRAVFLTIFFGSVAALVYAIIDSIRAGEFHPQMKLPFGPFLSLAALVYLFFGESILYWYLG